MAKNKETKKAKKEIQKKPKEKKVIKTVVKKPKKASIDDDEELQRLLNLEIERTELEQYEKIDVDFAKKPKTVEEVKVEEKPQKPEIEEVLEEVVLKPKPKEKANKSSLTICSLGKLP